MDLREQIRKELRMMFSRRTPRGRLDHFALNAPGGEAFWEPRRRVVAEGAGNGAVIDTGSLPNLGFTDPDGGENEVVWVKPGVPVEAGLRRAEWRTVELG